MFFVSASMPEIFISLLKKISPFPAKRAMRKEGIAQRFEFFCFFKSYQSLHRRVMAEEFAIPLLTKMTNFPARKAMPISQQPLNQQKIYAPKFGVAL